MQWKVDDTTQETLDTYSHWVPYAPRKCDSNCCCLNPQFCLSTNFLLFTRNTYKRYLPTFTFFILKLLPLSLTLSQVQGYVILWQVTITASKHIHLLFLKLIPINYSKLFSSLTLTIFFSNIYILNQVLSILIYLMLSIYKSI